jgi:hypothetical protein
MRTCLFPSGSIALFLTITAMFSLAGTTSTSLVEGFHYVSQPERSQITLQFDRYVRYGYGRLKNPDRLYIDLIDASPGPTWTIPSISPDDAFVKRIRFGHPELSTTRLVLDLKTPADASFAELKSPPRLLLILRPEHAAALTELEPPSIPLPATNILSLLVPSLLSMAASPQDAVREPLPVPQSPGNLPFPPVPGLPAIPPAPANSAPAQAAPPAPVLTPVPTETSIAPPTVSSSSQAVPARKLTIPRVTRPPTLEDFLNEAPREAEAVVRDFRQRAPHDGAPASESTIAYLSYDAERLYVVFVCNDTAGATRAHMAKRENISGEDTVGVYLDTFHDRQRSYLFEANPLGVQSDAIVSEAAKDPDYSFDAVWESEGRLTNFGFVLWMAIPFRALRFPGTEAQEWGIALTRSIPRNNENAFWPYVTSRVQGFTQQMATLDGLEKISPGHNVQLIPYITFANSRFLGQGPGLTTSNDARGGMDGKIIFKDALTLDFTANPDFSQVESDDPQVTVNQRYEVFFPEKRPFFLDNAAFFDTPTNLLYSRRIVDPNGGARLTGKLGRWLIGLLATDDRAPGQLVDPLDPLHDRLTSIGVVRVAREFAMQSSIGGFFSDRQFGSASNRIFSVDLRLKLNRNWNVQGQTIRSEDRALNGTRSSGSAYYLQTTRSDRHLVYSGIYAGFSPGFLAPLGFIQRVDIRQGNQYASYLWRPENGVVASFGPTVNASATYDHTGRLTDWSGGGQFDIYFHGPTNLTASRYQTYEYYLGQGFHKATSGLSFYTAGLKWLALYGSYSRGDSVNYSPAFGLQPFLGRAANASFGVTLRLPRLRLEQYYYFSHFEEGRSLGGLTAFNNHIAHSKVNYQFTHALSVRAIIDYYAQLPNESLVNQTHLKQVTTDLLVTYLIHPGTAAYIGYTNRFQNLAVDPANPLSLIPMGPPTFQTDRLLFVKLSYLLHF